MKTYRQILEKNVIKFDFENETANDSFISQLKVLGIKTDRISKLKTFVTVRSISAEQEKKIFKIASKLDLKGFTSA